MSRNTNLVLTRRAHERVIITLEDGRRISVTVAEVDRGKVRLAFYSPATVVIDRHEVADLKQRKTHAAEGAAVPEE